jgi:hypothetical protein
MPLRPRWSEVFDLASRGLSNKAIAQRMELSEQTVKNHLTKAYREISKEVVPLDNYNPRAWTAYHRGYSDGLKAATREQESES